MSVKPPRPDAPGAQGGSSAPAAEPPPANPVFAYLRALWSGAEPLHRVVISDMLIGGTLINVVAMAAAFALFAIEAPTWAASAVFFSPVPYNLFLVIAVWRSAGASGASLVWPARILALLWLIAMFFI
jgi:hypothetical protein